jgi:hypothetical protein
MVYGTRTRGGYMHDDPDPASDADEVGPVYDAMITRTDGHDPLVQEPLSIRT